MGEGFVFVQFSENLDFFILGPFSFGKFLELHHDPLLLLIVGEVHELNSREAAVDFLEPFLDFSQSPLIFLI